MHVNEKKKKALINTHKVLKFLFFAWLQLFLASNEEQKCQWRPYSVGSPSYGLGPFQPKSVKQPWLRGTPSLSCGFLHKRHFGNSALREPLGAPSMAS